MDRKEVCAKIRELNLQDIVKQHYGDNYTRVSNDKLEKLINAYTPNAQPAAKPEPKVETTEKAVVSNATVADSPLEAACLTFLGILKDAGLLDSMLAKL